MFLVLTSLRRWSLVCTPLSLSPSLYLYLSFSPPTSFSLSPDQFSLLLHTRAKYNRLIAGLFQLNVQQAFSSIPAAPRQSSGERMPLARVQVGTATDPVVCGLGGSHLPAPGASSSEMTQAGSPRRKTEPGEKPTEEIIKLSRTKLGRRGPCDLLLTDGPSKSVSEQ